MSAKVAAAIDGVRCGPARQAVRELFEAIAEALGAKKGKSSSAEQRVVTAEQAKAVLQAGYDTLKDVCRPVTSGYRGGYHEGYGSGDYNQGSYSQGYGHGIGPNGRGYDGGDYDESRKGNTELVEYPPCGVSHTTTRLAFQFVLAPY